MNEQKFLEKYKKKIIKECINSICKQYIVIDKDDNIVSSEKLNNVLTSNKTRRCVGCTTTYPITQCARNAVENFDYCKIHLYKIGIKESEDNQSENTCIIVDNKSDINKSNLIKKFIQDSFYYIDDKFIYSMNLEKVGYIHNNEYNLTCDPFILGLL